MAGYNDPYSGLFGEPGALNWPFFMWAGFATIIAIAMLLIFLGFDNDGFLHRLDRRFGIRKVEVNDEDLEMDY